MIVSVDGTNCAQVPTFVSRVPTRKRWTSEDVLHRERQHGVQGADTVAGFQGTDAIARSSKSKRSC